MVSYDRYLPPSVEHVSAASTSQDPDACACHGNPAAGPAIQQPSVPGLWFQQIVGGGDVANPWSVPSMLYFPTI